MVPMDVVYPQPYSSRSQTRAPLVSPSSRSTSGERPPHIYSLDGASGSPWLTLSLRSRSPNPSLLPLYYEGDTISGTVSVDLKKPDSVREISIALQGTISCGSQNVDMFLDVPQVLSTQPSGKLQGSHSWQFSLGLPRQIRVSEYAKGPPKSFPLPPKFSERGHLAHIDYKIIVTVKRRKFAVNSTLTTSLVYLPSSLAGPCSRLRQNAYRQGGPLPGPDADPEGWRILPPQDLKGKSSTGGSIHAQCTLAVASPLSFAAHSPVHLFVTITSTTSHSIDIISDPASLTVRLVRTTRVNDLAISRRGMTFNDVLGEAVFWPASDGVPSHGKTRQFEGELFLRKKLTPSFVFSKLSIQYSIALYPPRIPGFIPLASPREPLVSEPIQIVLKNPPGISPRSYTPLHLIPTSTRNSESDQPYAFAQSMGIYPFSC